MEKIRNRILHSNVVVKLKHSYFHEYPASIYLYRFTQLGTWEKSRSALSPPLPHCPLCDHFLFITQIPIYLYESFSGRVLEHWWSKVTSHTDRKECSQPIDPSISHSSAHCCVYWLRRMVVRIHTHNAYHTYTLFLPFGMPFVCICRYTVRFFILCLVQLTVQSGCYYACLICFDATKTQTNQVADSKILLSHAWEPWQRYLVAFNWLYWEHSQLLRYSLNVVMHA